MASPESRTELPFTLFHPGGHVINMQHANKVLNRPNRPTSRLQTSEWRVEAFGKHGKLDNSIETSLRHFMFKWHHRDNETTREHARLKRLPFKRTNLQAQTEQRDNNFWELRQEGRELLVSAVHARILSSALETNEARPTWMLTTTKWTRWLPTSKWSASCG